MQQQKEKVDRWDLSLLWTGQLDIILLRLTSWNHLLQLQNFIAELETAKSACLEIMSPVVMSAEKLGKENNLLQDKISALELELSNAKAENLALQGRVNEFY